MSACPIIDAHLHCTGQENADDILRALDEADVDVAVLLAPFLSDGYSMHDAASLRRANAYLARLVRGHGDRLVGMAVVNPSLPGAPQDLRAAIDDGLTGSKMVPSGWYPHDDRVQPTFAVASELALPLLFHSGIFIDGRSSRFCRPAEFEVLRDHPGARVVLAHLSWPWTDEAIALGLIDRIHGVPDANAAFRFDLSFGPPPPYRLEVLRRAFEVLGAGLLQFGSDCFLPCPGAQIAERRGWLEALLDELEISPADRAQVMGGTAASWLRRPLDGNASRQAGTRSSTAPTGHAAKPPSSSYSLLGLAPSARGWLTQPGGRLLQCC
ncbi:MAG TPA: amidohydrolase family protein [Burkholderiaceae bacterium]|jgi:predicted TIM-barrel fold metal-dependent hydrolase|nr:amidohydrolase family protein [Burkholderiaceae bacterium]